MTNQEQAQQILRLVGGKANVVEVLNCMTRLRVTLRDHHRADILGLQSTEGVLGVVDGETVQIVLGPGKAQKVADCFKRAAGMPVTGVSTEKTWEENRQSVQEHQVSGIITDFLKTVSSIFTPMLPAIIAVSILSGIMALMGQIPACQESVRNGVGIWVMVQRFFSLIRDGFMGYFVIYVGMRAAEVFGGTPVLGGILGAISMAGIYMLPAPARLPHNAALLLEFIYSTGNGGILGIIAACFLLSALEKKLRSVLPDMLNLLLGPVVALAVTVVAYLCLIMPVTGGISTVILEGLNLLVESELPLVRALTGFAISACFLSVVMRGYHHGMVLLYSMQLEQLGGISIFPCLAMAGAGQVGASAAIWLKARRVGNRKMDNAIRKAMPAGLLGIGEPLIYGVTLPLRKPFLTAGLGAGFGGGLCLLMGLRATGWGLSGILAAPLMKTPRMMLWYAAGLGLSYLMGFVITWLLVSKGDVKNA